MSNNITSALSELDSAISAVESGTPVTATAVRNYIEAARDDVDEVPALVGFANNWLDGAEFAGDYGTQREGYEWQEGQPDIDHAHSLRVLRGRFALNDEEPPVFGASGS